MVEFNFLLFACNVCLFYLLCFTCNVFFFHLHAFTALLVLMYACLPVLLHPISLLLTDFRCLFFFAAMAMLSS